MMQLNPQGFPDIIKRSPLPSLNKQKKLQINLIEMIIHTSISSTTAIPRKRWEDSSDPVNNLHEKKYLINTSQFHI